MKTERLMTATLFVLLSYSATAGDSLLLLKTTLDSGGSESAAGPFVLRASIGQSDAGNLRGAGYQLQGGFWAASAGDFLFVDGFEEN